ncbi:SigE family RNA polymerase sigma factor [Nocardioides sp. cx-169]|uniref:SigE family RNA polymerase sigma factor n=1 Tax=Nocardioides sp. cx-169 TaxID=2899080 RepID=UPI001E49743F|nr:SigE family RNA polymerase sigma factor [Nocardioides sp. cx-169]MCD4533615.1 SigE family RNA polymerase sigma factor [Nocardioides sp. cx-169]
MDPDTEFASWAEEAWPALVRSAVFLGCRLPEAEDLVQTTLARCYSAWAKVRAADNRDAYVYRMLVNGLRDSKRRRWWGEQATEVLPEGRTGARDPMADVDTADAIHRAMAGLSKVNRDVVVLRYFAQLTEQQTADALGVPPGTVKSRLSRALAQLAADHHLADLSDGPSPRRAP